MTIAYKKVILGLCILLLPCSSFAAATGNPRQARQVETRADRAFIRGDYDRAMKLYSQATNKLGADTPQRLGLELKMARLYTLLQAPSEAIPHYRTVQQAVDTMLTVNDVCFFVDALRLIGQDQQAEVIARHYAFLSPYRLNQRYLNTLNSLTNLQRYYSRGDSDYAVKMLEKSTALPDYWVGKWDGDLFFAVSNSRIQDPLKIYYHQTQYFSVNDSGQSAPFRAIPRELQSGPVAFSDDKKVMVATGIHYRPSDRIIDVTGQKGMFVTQIYYSAIDLRRDSWRKFEPLFEHQENYNYAHPSFFNDGKSIVFSSDRSGGYGGMDLYIAHWNDIAQTWSDPVNLGPGVNTEGDEIFPRIEDGGLYFASNGLEGFGGYDIFRASFAHNLVTPGSRYHYPYPINTVSNDFGISFEGNVGYFISDRRGFASKDDIYTFDASISPLNSQNIVGVSDEYSAMLGNLNLIRGLKSSNTETLDKELMITPIYYVPEKGEVMVSFYFDFNSAALDAEAMITLRKLLDDPALGNVSELSLLGYADEFGSQQYNMHLSRRRAEAVANAMRRESSRLPELFIEGRGQLTLSPGEYAEAAKQTEGKFQLPANYEFSSDVPRYALPFDELVKLNRALRRVDVVVKRK